MPWAVAGAAVAAGGAYLAADKQADAAKEAGQAASFRPYNVFSGANGAQFNPNGQVNIDVGGIAGGLSSEMTRQAYNGLTQPNTQAQFFQQAGLSDFASANANMSGLNLATPGAANRVAGSLSALANKQSSLGQQGIQAAFGAPSAAGLTNQAQNYASQFLNTGPAPTMVQGQSFNGLASERLSALRAMARTGEDRAVDSKMNNLFSSGRLGTTGGSRAMGELALQQDIADQNRVVESMNFADSQQNQDRSFNLSKFGMDQNFFQNQQQMGTSMLGQAFQGVGMDQAVAANLGSLGGSLMGQSGQTRAASLAATQAGDASQISQAERRLSGAQQLFGFGQAVDNSQFNRSAQQLGLSQTIESQGLDLARFGASVGSAQSSANANAGALAMQGANGGIGTALQGFGTGVANMTPAQTDNVNSFFSGIFT